MQSDQISIEYFKNLLIKENKFNKSKRRTFSMTFKKELIAYMSEYRVPMIQVSKELSIAHSTLDKWKKEFKSPKSFKKVTVAKNYTNKTDNQILKIIKWNQTFLIALLILLLIERLLLHLIS